MHTTRPLEGWFLKNILVVDDTADCREPLARLLEISGYNPTTAVNGLDALAHLDSDQPDLILLDLMMPGMDGFTLLSRLRTEPALQNLPVIMLSALSDEKRMTRAKELGARDYLVKTCFTYDDLLRRVEQHCKH